MQPITSLNDLLINVSKCECILLGMCLSYIFSLIEDILYDIWKILYRRLKNDK